MKRKLNHPIRSAWAALIFMALACNLPSGTSGTPDFPSTAAAETVAAQLTANAPSTGTATVAAVPATNTSALPAATTAVVPSATSNCDVSQFITDVTIPDGYVVTPGQAFTKTWRLKNVGTCSWTSSYAVVYSSGNQMGGPSTQALTGNVNPGQTVDISVNLTAPGSNGDYTGYWKLRNASGVLFAQFYVQIEVAAALPPPIAAAVLTSRSAEDGYVTSGGSIFGPINVGDLDDNGTAEAFLSFDMSSIPSSATVTKVVVDFSDYDTLGNPWTISDGCLRGYVQNFGTLDVSDYFVGDPLSAVLRFCGTGDLNTVGEDADMIAVVQNRVGTTRLQLRMQFRTPTSNGNGVADMVRLGEVKLTVTYH